MFGKHRCTSRLEEQECLVYVCLLVWVVRSCERQVQLTGGEEGPAF
jgi:hypothetical protein